MRLLIAVLIAIATVALVLHADEVELVTGEKLEGKVVEMAPGHVTLDHPVLGRLEIPAETVKSVTQYGPTPVEPTEEAQPPADEPAPAAAPAGTPAPPPAQPAPASLGVTTEPTGEVSAEATPEPAPEAPDQTPAEAPEAAGPAPWLSALHDLNVQLELGANGSQGNTETADLRAALKAGRETDKRRWAFDTAYFYSTTDGDTSRNDLTLGLVNDWLFKDSPWFVFAQGRADFDDFQDWDYRVNGAGGVGYQLIDTDAVSLRLRGGVGAVQEFGSDDETLRPEGSFGGELNWVINERQTFGAAVTAFPSFDEAGEVRVRANADWTLKIDQADGVSIKLGVVEEYDSLAGAGTDKNDFKYYAALVVDF